MVGQILDTEIYIAPDGTVGEHNTLGETGSTTGIVNHAQLFWLVNMPIDVVLAEQFVQSFAGICQRFVVRGV